MEIRSDKGGSDEPSSIWIWCNTRVVTQTTYAYFGQDKTYRPFRSAVA